MIWVQANRTATCFLFGGNYGENGNSSWLLEFKNYFAIDFTGFHIMLKAFWREYYIQVTFCHFTQFSQIKLQKQLKYTQMFQQYTTKNSNCLTAGGAAYVST